MRELFSQVWSGRRDLVLVILMISILMVLFAPIPSVLLDFLLVINITLALLILLATFFTETPLKFSTFPTILLLATLFRLALNVSATRLILEGANGRSCDQCDRQLRRWRQLCRRHRGLPDPGRCPIRGRHKWCPARC